jgi:hypothetical protein
MIGRTAADITALTACCGRALPECGASYLSPFTAAIDVATETGASPD